MSFCRIVLSYSVTGHISELANFHLALTHEYFLSLLIKLNHVYHGTFTREQRRLIYSRIRVRTGRVKKLLSRGKKRGKRGRGLSIHSSICPSSCQRVSESDCCPTSFVRPAELSRVSILTAMRNICLSGVVTVGGTAKARIAPRDRRVRR